MKKTWTALVLLCISIQCPVVSWGYLLHNSLKSFIQRHASGTSSDNEWIIYRFWIHLLLLFAIASDVMRNDLFVFKIFIPTLYCCNYQSKRLLIVIHCHSLSLVVSVITRFHSLSFVVPLVVICCRYHSSFFLSTILGKHLQIRRRHLWCVARFGTICII